MNLRVHLAVLAVLALSATAVFAADDGPVLTGIVGNLAAGDSTVNVSNDGASGGSICVNVYAFSPDEQLVSCCACPLTVHATVSLSAMQEKGHTHIREMSRDHDEEHRDPPPACPRAKLEHCRLHL